MYLGRYINISVSALDAPVPHLSLYGHLYGQKLDITDILYFTRGSWPHKPCIYWSLEWSGS